MIEHNNGKEKILILSTNIAMERSSANNENNMAIIVTGRIIVLSLSLALKSLNGYKSISHQHLATLYSWKI